MKAKLLVTLLATTCAVANVQAETNDSFEPTGNGFVSVFMSQVDLGRGLKGDGLGVRGGYQLTDNWGVVGSASVMTAFDSSDYKGEEVYQDFSGWMINVGPSYYLTDNFSLFATVGVVNYKSEQSTRGETVYGTAIHPETHQPVQVAHTPKENIVTDDETNVVYGIGANYFIGDVSINVMYQRFDYEFSMQGDKLSSASDTVSVGVGFRY